jgi:hypothetical protein
VSVFEYSIDYTRHEQCAVSRFGLGRSDYLFRATRSVAEWLAEWLAGREAWCIAPIPGVATGNVRAPTFEQRDGQDAAIPEEEGQGGGLLCLLSQYRGGNVGASLPLWRVIGTI